LGNSTNKPVVVNGFNVSDVSWTISSIATNRTFGGYTSIDSFSNGVNFLVTLTNPVPNTNYCLVGTGGEPGNRSELGVITYYPFQQCTTTKFTMSYSGGDFSGHPESDWFSFVVYC